MANAVKVKSLDELFSLPEGGHVIEPQFRVRVVEADERKRKANKVSAKVVKPSKKSSAVSAAK
jgi:hypothetical protein